MSACQRLVLIITEPNKTVFRPTGVPQPHNCKTHEFPQGI